MPVGFKLRFQEFVAIFGSKFLQLIRSASQSFAETVDVAKTVDVISVSLVVACGKPAAMLTGQLLDPIEDA